MSEKIEYKGYKIVITQDEDAPNPREEWDNLGVMVTAHSRYTLGDVQIGTRQTKKLQPWSFPDVEEFDRFIRQQKKCVILPLYMYDHFSITIRTSSAMFRAIDHAGWDWGLLGYIFATGNMIKKEFGVKVITDEVIENAKKILTSEVEIYDDYVNGNVYCFDIYAPPPGYEYDKDYNSFINEDGEEFVGYWDDSVDSIGGIFGYSECVTDAKAMVDWHIADTAKKEAERVQKIETNHVLLFEKLEAVGL